MSRNQPPQPVIRIAAALLRGADGRTLLVRKRGTIAFMQPGGKIERHEAPIHALVRELYEELGLVVEPTSPVYLGRFVASAANEPDHLVEAELFEFTTLAEVRPASEIEEIVWLDPTSPTELVLAPLTRDHVLPLLGPPFAINEVSRRAARPA